MKEAFTGKVFLFGSTLFLPAGMMWGLGAVVLLQLHPDSLTEEATPVLRIVKALWVSGGWTCAGFAGAGVVILAARGGRWWFDRRARRERARLDAQVAAEAVLDVPGWTDPDGGSG